MKSAKLLFAISLSALAAGCVSGPGADAEFATPAPVVTKARDRLAPDIQKILAAGGLDPANPSAASTPEDAAPRAVALALAQTPSSEPVKATRTPSQTKHAKPVQVPRPTRSVKQTPSRTQVTEITKPTKRSVTRF